MSRHTEIRWETQDGTVISYLAPNFEVRPVSDNDLKGAPRPRGEPAILRDFQLFNDEITLQGEFLNSDEYPDSHASDVEALIGSSPATAREQINRIMYYIHSVGGPYHLYEGTDEYTAANKSETDWENGVFPKVQLDQFRRPSQGGFSRFEYMIKFRLGVRD